MRNIYLFIFILLNQYIGAQLLPELNYPKNKYEVKKWSASWITSQDIAEADYSITMFRKSFHLNDKPNQFIIHISADNRYKLFINGILSSIGPQGSDWRHWRYETIDIAPYLKTGDNLVAAEVENWGPDRFFGIMSIRTAFILQGLSEKEMIINTGQNSGWKAKQNTAYSPLMVRWIYGTDIVGGFYASNPGDSINVKNYPNGWNQLSFDDHNWNSAKWIWNASNSDEGGFFWLMKPRTTPQVSQEKQYLQKIVRTTNIHANDDFLNGKASINVPPHTKGSLLFDNQKIILGFPQLFTSKGKGSKITICYAENLIAPDMSRGDRNDIQGKSIRGVHDVILLDGKDFHYSPTWYRAFRYVQIDVETTDQPLIIKDFYNQATAAPLERKASFQCNNPEYEEIDKICWQTLKICTQDNLMSDAYYEQMMYVGDSQIHALGNLFMTGQNIWLRNAIEQFDYSRMPDGNITSCYPLKSTFVHPTFSLIWIDMLYDFMMYCGEKEFIQQYAQSVRATLNWFKCHLNDNGLVGKPVGSYFVDWYSDKGFEGEGCYPGSQNGNSAVVTLHYAATLLKAAEIFEYIGLSNDASIFKEDAEKVKQAVIKTCWDEKKQMFAETPDKSFFDERANIMAITARIFDDKKQKELLMRCINDKTISKPDYYFRNYHFNEMRRLGEGDHISKVLDIWKALLPLHFTTTPERIARQRSDSHPWSTAPAMAFLKVVAGIAPQEPGFKSVSIKPAFGELNYIKAIYPHYLGNIKVELKKKNNNGIIGTVELPIGLTGSFEYDDKIIPLKEGIQNIDINN